MKTLLYILILFCILINIISSVHVKYKDLNNYDGNLSLKIKNNYSIFLPDEDAKYNNIMIALYINNHAYSLPTFLATLETLKCPNFESKCHLWVMFHNCNDDSKDIFISWLSTTRPSYDKIIMIDTKNDEQTKVKHPELNKDYFSRNLKKRAIAYGIDNKISHIFFISADAILTNEYTLNILVEKKKPIVAPLLKSFSSKYSTFYTDFELSNDNKEKKEEYRRIYNQESIGCHKIDGVRDCYLVDLTTSNIKNLLDVAEKHNDDEDDDHGLSESLKKHKILAYVCNRENFGYITNLNKKSKEERIEEFTYLRMEHLLNGPDKSYNKPLPVSQHIDKYLFEKPTTKLGFDKIYVINLERRSDRKERIESALNDLNIEYSIFNAIDAKKINESYIDSLGIKVLPDYKDPYNDRSINYGEISCFLSHYFIWKEAVENNYKKIIILEDDARFTIKFKSVLLNLVNQMGNKKIDWELMFLGRKIMRSNENGFLDGIKFDNYGLIKPAYSHWTVAYALTNNGAQKLFNQEPLKKIVPVDEYIPIMYDEQPNEYWASFFKPRNLIAFSIYPVIVSPTHYFGEPGYISDTENTATVNTDLFKFDKNENENTIEIPESNYHFEL